MWINSKRYSDLEVIIGLQNHNRDVEKYFFDKTYQYFERHFNQLFFDQDSKQEIFQTAIVKLWTEIENKTIRVADGKISRKQKDGGYAIMTATLNTFLMAFAKNEFRELLRDHKEDNIDEVITASESSDIIDETINEEEELIRIVDKCILTISPSCREIITLFYYQKKSLDEIIELRGEKNSSKNGLKSAKNKCMNVLRQRIEEELKKM